MSYYSSTLDFGRNNVNAGPVPGLSEICIDRFVGKDLECTTFFLSHAHTDHMAGLDTEACLKRLREPGVKLYCQAITPILLTDFERGYLGGESGIRDLIKLKKLVPLDSNKTEEIEVPAKCRSYTVKVTLLTAGHCPGSVMFLFETDSKRILHTGDCRLSVNDLKGIRCLHTGETTRTVKNIDHLLFDSTFCAETANQFPDRKTAFDVSISHISAWLQGGRNRCVKLCFAARFCHEYIILEIFKKFRKKTHVSTARFGIYEHIPELQDCVTLDSDTPFHLCGNDDCVRSKEVLNLRLASQWYTRTEDTSVPVSKTGNTLRVCYAMHSSLAEITEMIDYLRPRVATPLVLPIGSSIEMIEGAVRKLCKWKFVYEDYQTKRKLRKPTPQGVEDLATTSIAETAEDDVILIANDTTEKCPKKLKSNHNGSKWNYKFTADDEGLTSARINVTETECVEPGVETKEKPCGWKTKKLHQNHGF